MTKERKVRTYIFVILVLTLFSCVALNLSGAQYYSAKWGKNDFYVSKFIVNIRPGNDDDLTLTPTAEGGFTTYEFWVSNEEDAKVSGVSQYYNVGLVIPTDAMTALSRAMEDGSLQIRPILVHTNATEMSFEELYALYNAGNLPEDMVLNVYKSFDVIESQSDEENTVCTWFTEEEGEQTPVSFAFQADNPTAYKHFVVFVGFGELAANESYQINGMQVVVYSEQKIG